MLPKVIMNSKSAQLLHESVSDQWPRWTTCSLQCVRTAPSLVHCRPPKSHGGLSVATVCRHMVHAKAAVPAQNDGPCREHNSVAFNIHTCKHIYRIYSPLVLAMPPLFARGGMADSVLEAKANGGALRDRRRYLLPLSENGPAVRSQLQWRAGADGSGRANAPEV